MIIFVTLTRWTDGDGVRFNPAQIAAYYALRSGSGSTLLLAGPALALDVRETPEQIDALMVRAAAQV